MNCPTGWSYSNNPNTTEPKCERGLAPDGRVSSNSFGADTPPSGASPLPPLDLCRLDESTVDQITPCPKPSSPLKCPAFPARGVFVHVRHRSTCPPCAGSSRPVHRTAERKPDAERVYQAGAGQVRG